MNLVFNDLLAPLLLVILGGFFIIAAWLSMNKIKRSAGRDFKKTDMRVINVSLAQNQYVGDVVSGPLTDKTAMVMVHYQYTYNGEKYICGEVFPHHIEHVKPRMSPMILFEELKRGHVSQCYVDCMRPSEALLFVGFTPYLKSHVAGVFASGILVVMIGLFLFAVS